MKDQAINIAIAEAVGWTWEQPFNKRKAQNWLIEPNGTGRIVLWRDGKFGGTSLPDYCNDLNAMHEVEMTLQHYGVFVDNLAVVWNVKRGSMALVLSTARQRAEAFLRTIGKWVKE